MNMRAPPIKVSLLVLLIGLSHLPSSGLLCSRTKTQLRHDAPATVREKPNPLAFTVKVFPSPLQTDLATLTWGRAREPWVMGRPTETFLRLSRYFMKT